MTDITHVFSCHCSHRLPLLSAAAKFFLTFDDSLIIIRFRNWRRTSEGDSLVFAHSRSATPLILPNPFRIRRSKRPLPQLLYNLHLQHDLGTADSNGLTIFRFLPQLLYFPHLQDPLGCVANKRLITPLESALTRISPVTSLESAVTKRAGVGVFWLSSRPVAQRFPLRPQPILQSLSCGISLSVRP
jgi:hypothetical protein